MQRVSERAIGRLSLYRRVLYDLQMEGQANVFSHDLASLAGVTAAQVRRDVMTVGFEGSPSRGYNVDGLAESVSTFLGGRQARVALVGVGNLGRAILSYFLGRRPNLQIVAAFDTDPDRTGRVIAGCHSYSMDELAERIEELEIVTAILSVPADAAQPTADLLVASGVRGLVNFAPVRLSVPAGVYVENVDITMSLEKVAFFARQNEAKEALQ